MAATHTHAQGYAIDPALLKLCPAAARAARFHVPNPSRHTLHSSSSTAPPADAQISTIGVGYAAVASGSQSTIGVGYDSTSHAAAQAGVSGLEGSMSMGYDFAIDPALLQLEAVVKSVRASWVARDTPGGFRAGEDGERRAKRARLAGPPRSAGARVGTESSQNTYAPTTFAQMDMGTGLNPEIDPTLQGGGTMDHDSGTGLGEEFDPTIREIVKSLTKAQENHPQETQNADMHLPSDAETDAALTQALTDAQTVAAISAHLLAAEGMEQDIQNSLADMTPEQMNSFFHPTSGTQDYLLPDYTNLHSQSHNPNSAHQSAMNLTDLDKQITSALQSATYAQSSAQASSSSVPIAHADHNGADSDSDSPTGKRKRGRPRGSKNKPRPGSEHLPPKEPKVREKAAGPTKKIGRPLKERTGAELEAWLKKQADEAAGIKRSRGRPRKFPGYLVRNMRLKANREEFREVVLRSAEEGQRAGSEIAGSQAGADGQWGHNGGEGSRNAAGDGVGKGEEQYHPAGIADEERNRNEEEEEYDWANDPQNLIDAVSGQMRAADDLGLRMEGMEEGSHQKQMLEERQEDEPSADTGLDREGMGHVFGLEGVEGEVEGQA